MNEELKVVISAEVAKFKQGVQRAKSEITEFKVKVKEAGDKADEAWKNAGKGIADGIKNGMGAAVDAVKTGATAMVAGVTAITGAIIGVTASTEEYRENMAKLETAFEAVDGWAEDAVTTYNDLYRVLGDTGQATEAAAHLAKLTEGNTKSLAKWTEICTGVYATFGDSLPIEGLTEAANETMRTGQVTGSLADALNWGTLEGETFGVTLKENTKANEEWNKAVMEATSAEDYFNLALSQCNDEAEREKLIRETLLNTYDFAAEVYEENNKAVLDQREAQAKLQETMAKLGEVLTPLVTAFTTLANDALAAVMPYLTDLAEKYGPMIVPVIKDLAATYLPMLKDILLEVANGLQVAFEWAVEHKTLLATIGGIIGGIVTAIGLYNAVAAVKTAMAAAEVTTVWGLVTAYAAQAAAMIVALAPYLLIVAAIAAVIAIIVLCVKHWDEIKAAVAKAWDFIKEKTSAAVDAVVNWFNKLKEKIKVHIDNIKQNITTIFSNIKETIVAYIRMASEIVLSIFDGIKNGIKNRIEMAKSIITNVLKLIKAIFTGDFGAARDAVLGIFDSIKNGISKSLENAKNTVKKVIDAIKGFFNFTWSLPKLKMPSIKITGKFSLSPLSVPKFSISWHKLGGVFDKPTLFNYGGSLHGLGEDGAEAVVPLERNTEWLTKLAGMLNERMGGNRPIVLQVDGKTFAEISVESINQLTRQRGSLPLTIM